MTDERKDGVGGLLDLERELTCSICCDILYQPLTLLDCLHTFCGGCLKEWFRWQALDAARQRRSTRPYTCPSCRESVRGTKADWRLTALLEGYLKANPDKAKSEEDKDELRKQYTPGDDVLPAVQWEAEVDSEDERLLADVRELSMGNLDPETARRRTERVERVQQRRRQNRDAAGRTRPEEVGRAQQPSRIAQQIARHDGPGERHVEHQSSLRSLLSGSEVDSQEMQQEILHSIYSEGLLDGIDVDNLTPEQEEELTERIAEAYRRRQRQRERSRNRERQEEGNRPSNPTSSPRSESPTRAQVNTSNSGAQQTQSRNRPPVSRPHLFEQTTADSNGSHGGSTSATSQNRNRSSNRANERTAVTSASRSATDLSDNPSTHESQRERQRASSTNARSSTDPETTRDVARHARSDSANLRPEPASPRTRSFDSQSRDPDTRRTRVSDDPGTPRQSSPPSTSPRQAARPIHPTSRTAPEAVRQSATPQSAPSITCTRCSKSNIQHSLHYNCPKCHNGSYNLCLSCYRGGHGCGHWFGFGFRAAERWSALAPPEGWPQNYDRPHVMYPRRWTQSSPSAQNETLQEGAFCESCIGSADSNTTSASSSQASRSRSIYWYCDICLEGAWGFCNPCLLRGSHCTHPLLPLVPSSTPSSYLDPKPLIIPVPHLPPNSRTLLQQLPPITCGECSRPIPPQDSRNHCYECNEGDYDLCNSCFSQLVRSGRISAAEGPNGWRRCPRVGHRMGVVQFIPAFYGDKTGGGRGGGGAEQGYARLTIAEPVGGWRFKEDLAARQSSSAPPPPPPPSSSKNMGERFVATWSRFPGEGNTDELTFPRNAEIREGEEMNVDWAVGVYMGKVGVFPSNHVRRI